ncbi:MAG: hypothetical protein HC779_04540, partial [Phyllobacteriaceae bacterium]|nr:hypothetical protein [Phyllobacteriaceae bacterium]
APIPGAFAGNLYLRALGLCAIALAVLHMARIVGVGPLEPARFDLMPVHWRVASTILVVTWSAAGFGLWQLARWGSVVWSISIIMQIAMHTVYAPLFGENQPLVAVLLGLAAIQLAFYIYFRHMARRTASGGVIKY